MSANENKKFYEDFLRLCNSVGKTPCRVVVECGLSKPCVTRWKNGSLPTDATTMKIADYFGLQNWRPEDPADNRVKVRRIRILRKGGLHDS